MIWVLLIPSLASLAQLLLCGFSLYWLIAIIGRILFMLRFVGANFTLSTIRGFEVASLFVMCVGILFTKTGVDWSSKFIFCLCSLISYVTMLIDDKLFLYVTEDYNEEEDE